MNRPMPKKVALRGCKEWIIILGGSTDSIPTSGWPLRMQLRDAIRRLESMSVSIANHPDVEDIRTDLEAYHRALNS